MPLRTLFFDAAGTLIRPAEPVGNTYSQFARKLGIIAEPEAIMQAFRQAWKETSSPFHAEGQTAEDDDRSWWEALVGKVFGHVLGAPLADETLEALFGELYPFYSQPQAWVVFDDVLPALADLSRDHRLLVLSNFDRRLLSILGGHGLLRFFERVIISSEVGAAKPHARMFQAALAVSGCRPEECLHIGDDVKCDLEGAQSCGIHAFHVKRPGSDLASMVQKVRSGAYSGLRTAEQ